MFPKTQKKLHPFNLKGNKLSYRNSGSQLVINKPFSKDDKKQQRKEEHKILQKKKLKLVLKPLKL